MNETPEAHNTTPPWIYFLLILSVIGVSCAGTMFQQIDDIPPLLRASWRLQATSVCLFPLAMMQWYTSEESMRHRFLKQRTLLIMLISGISVGAHFGCWVASLDMTTLTHSLLFVSAHPVVIAMGMYLLANLPVAVLDYLQSHGMASIRSPNQYEGTGVLLGVVGASITLLDVGAAQGRHRVTLAGDLVAFMGAITFISYQVCGRILRDWMPIFVYAFPVTLLGSLVLVPLSILVEPTSSDFGILGWATRKYFYWFLALSLIAGLLGHTGLNTCLKHLSPLVVCSSTMMEPMIGSLAGWLAYDGGLPGEWTTGGGIILIFSVFLVSYGTHTAQNIEMGDEEDSKADIEAVDTSKDHSYSSVAQELVLVKMVKNGVNTLPL